MPQFKIQIFKRIGAAGKEWSNVYHWRDVDIESASAAAGSIIVPEIAVHKANVTFVRARISTEAPGDGQYIVQPINEQGAIAVGAGQLPLFNTVRVDFAVSFGRPSYKYLRLPLAETEQEDGNVNTALANLLETDYMVPLVSLSPSNLSDPGLTDESGNGFVSASVWAYVQERQLRRRKRRRQSTGIVSS